MAGRAAACLAASSFVPIASTTCDERFRLICGSQYNATPWGGCEVGGLDGVDGPVVAGAVLDGGRTVGDDCTKGGRDDGSALAQWHSGSPRVQLHGVRGPSNAPAAYP